MSGCRFVSRDQPRMVCSAHIHHERGEWCEACSPCPERHCRVCGYSHHEWTCPTCLTEARDNIAEIVRRRTAQLEDEAETRGPTSEAVMLIGPAADPEARGHLEASVAAGRVPAHYAGETVGENHHPDWVLGSWEMVYRDAFDHDTDDLYELTTAADYLDRNLTYASTWPHVPFEDFAKALRVCAGHLASVVHDLDDHGAPCLKCNTDMVRAVDAKGATTDDWWCERCKRVVKAAEYEYAARTAYRDRADRLNATDLAIRLNIPLGTIRRWASVKRTVGKPTLVNGEWVAGIITETPPLLRSCGRDWRGRKVYRVATAEQVRDRLRTPRDDTAEPCAC